MSRKFIAALSGTYNVHAHELAHGGSAGNVQQVSGASTGAGSSSILPAAFAKFVRQQSVQQSPPPQVETIKCVVYFLDDSQHIFEVDRTAKGEELLDLVFRHLELIEREYFALQFTEMIHHHYGSTSMLNSSRWLDPSKKIRKQMRFTSSPYILHFRVKFYVSDVGRLFEEYTRYHYYLQLRKDILSGRLSGDDSTLALLASYVLQSELGDYSEEDFASGYASRFRYIPNQTEKFEAKVEKLHRRHQGQTPADVELNYLDEAKNLDLYGVDLHHAKDCENHDIQIGVSGNGLTVFKQSIRVNTFSWAKIVKISFKRRFFFVQLKHEGTERFDNAIGFNLCSYRACKALWKACVEQHTFFRLHTPKPLTKKFFFFFSLGSKFRYSGKTEFQTIEENKKRLTRTERIFIRNNARNATMPALSSVGKMNEAQKHLANLRLTNNEKPTKMVTDELNGKLGSNGTMSSSSSESTFDTLPPTPPLPLLQNGSLHKSAQSTVNSTTNNSTSVLTAIAATNSHRFSSGHNVAYVPPIPQPPQRKSSILSHQTASTSRSSSISSASSYHQKVSTISLGCSTEKNGKHDLKLNGRPCSTANGTCRHTNGIGDNDNNNIDNQRQPPISSASTTTTATTAYSPSAMISLPFIDQDKTSTSIVTNATSSTAADTIPVIEDNSTIVVHVPIVEDDVDNYRKEVEKEIDSPIRELIKELYDVAATETAAKSAAVQLDDSPEDSSASSPVHLMTVSMKPDQEGRFGFNVKGGFDQHCAVLVSRVAPNTPADNAFPTKLREGDQVISINGTEVSGLNHEEVVQLIRSTKDNGPEAELVLLIRPNVFHHHHQCDDDSIEEPPFQYTTTDEENAVENMPSSGNNRLSMEPVKSLLDISMNLLQEGLESESLIVQFEQLYRRNEKEPISIARFQCNVLKNRYLDIAPYDSTRVILNDCITGDYINASHVVMEIEASGTVNRYIATQGPLKRTTSDFWQMIWEQRSTVIVMVTPLVEDGRKKCFKYWPDDNQTVLINDQLELSLEGCKDETAFLERKFKLTDLEVSINGASKHELII
ncbi:PREDICTED: tyrosine-protein phosphatase non-receptor type 4-like [Rhagoletis zephyria]|uniref:tyrosine-protein phosphatase non-receptor type 4-like n=1 Tax=Rhagoletis zephyria TaxID=28612 RepID=UPI0008113E4D|nr:PREDICTED: tyrosine-protein phosphatase non-receptor type 4-like [Rhagoletis zephyria]